MPNASRVTIWAAILAFVAPIAMFSSQSAFARSAPEANAFCRAACAVVVARAWYSLLQREPYISLKTECRSLADGFCPWLPTERLESRAFGMS